MAEKKKEDKIILEREYTVPLRKKFINTPQYKRTPKAVKALKEFIAKHMRVEDRDTDLVKMDTNLNLEFWMGSIRRPPAKIKVKAKKYESGVVKVELAEIPQFLKWKIEKEKKRMEAGKAAKPAEKKEEEKKQETKEDKEIKEEKKESVKEAELVQAEKLHKEMKHTTTKEKPKVHRMALQK